jgi:hypothetical protein
MQTEGGGAHGDWVHVVPPSLGHTLFRAIGVGKGWKWGRRCLCTPGKEGGEGGQSTPALFCSCSVSGRQGGGEGGHAPLHSRSPPPDGCVPPAHPSLPALVALPCPSLPIRVAQLCPARPPGLCCLPPAHLGGGSYAVCPHFCALLGPKRDPCSCMNGGGVNGGAAARRGSCACSPVGLSGGEG